MKNEIVIDGRPIGPGHPPYVICEVSANHNGSIDKMMELLDSAAATGCDAIKIQSYTADTMTIDSDREEFQIKGGPWDGRRLHDLYAEAGTPFEWHDAIFAKARDLGVTLFSTPFDFSAADMLAELDAPAYKIASFELVDLPLIRYVASKGKPMIMSTGLGNLAEIEAAVDAARSGGCEQLALLHCVSAYPAPVEESNVLTVQHLGATFDVVAGLSDHTMGSAVSVAAVAQGAAIIEKHFTMRRSDGGPDSGFSLEPEEFRKLCDDCRDGWAALGKAGYGLKNAESGNAAFRRSLYAVRDIAEGETITADNMRSIRPGFGLAPKFYDQIIGRKAARNIERGEGLSWDALLP